LPDYAKVSTPKITFGIIVLNGEPFTRYCIRQLYPYAHEIIVVEGASPSASAIATHDGHSMDGTLKVLRNLQQTEDPEHKLVVVTAEEEGYSDGFWPGEKDEQSRAYANRATGDYLWQVDIDEFYRAEDIESILMLLENEPDITAVSFKQITFWGGLDYVVDGWYLRSGADVCHRIFRWGPGYCYISHRPPTVVNEKGQDLRTMKWVSGEALASKGIFLYHYSLLFPRQVKEKCSYYGNAAWARRSEAEKWAQDVFIDLKMPYRVHNVYTYPSWLDRFRGNHPEQILAMHKDIRQGTIIENLRPADDIEAILNSKQYSLGRRSLKLLTPAYLLLKPLGKAIDRILAAIWKRATLLVRVSTQQNSR
ncbi:MAG TPA: glycosyltransferase family A protein, partial [Deltaproteobacteria bacterium]|nr:glycosyltransferase family A protein [Deltaproteobacteria bacterium]